MDDPFLPQSTPSSRKYLALGLGLAFGGFTTAVCGVLVARGATNDDPALIPLAVGLAMLGLVTGGLFRLVSKGVGEEDGSHRRVQLLAFATMIATVVVAASCLGVAYSGPEASKPPPAPAPTFSVGGTLSGFTGSRDDPLTLANAGEQLELHQDGKWVLRSRLQKGATYSVTVHKNPARQTCNVSNGSGTVGEADVTNIEVTCR